MKRHRHTPEQVVRKLREGERMLNEGTELVEVLRQLEISEATWNRWRNSYGGMKAEEAKRLRELERENARLKKIVADKTLEIDMLKELAYVMDAEIAGATGGARYYFKHPQTGLGVDIFMDELYYCHRIAFRGRLQVDRPTIPLAELLLEKMQIVELNEKDVKDTIVLLLEHDIGEDDDEKVNARLIADILSDDWGFYHTVNMNLDRVLDHLQDYAALGEDDRRLVTQRIDDLRSRIEARPKSLRWKARARVGTRTRWYQQVEAKP